MKQTHLNGNPRSSARSVSWTIHVMYGRCGKRHLLNRALVQKPVQRILPGAHPGVDPVDESFPIERQHRVAPTVRPDGYHGIPVAGIGRHQPPQVSGLKARKVAGQK